MTLEPNEKKSQSLRRGLVLSLIGLQLVTVALILFITHVSTRHDIDKQASLLLQYALNESKEHTEGFLEPSYRNVQLTADLLAQDVISLDNKSQLEHYFLNQLKNNPEMTGIYIAKPEGDFYFVSRSNKDEKIGFMTKEISANNPGKASFYWRYESPFITESHLEQDDTYQANTRPWYQQAVAKKSLIWTEPYIFYTSKLPGITVATPFYNTFGELEGVVGIDIALINLSRFLEALKIYDSVSVFMISASGNFVASPSMSAESKVLETLSITADQSASLSVDAKAAKSILQAKDSDESGSLLRYFFHDDAAQLIRYEPFMSKGGPEWTMGAYAPESAFLSTIKQGENRNTGIALSIMFLSLLIGWLLIKKTWRPFEHFFHDVVTDQLTGLFNRRFLENVGSRLYIRLMHNEHEVISIAAIDLDHFKKINAEFGHSVGNQVLVAFAELMKKTLRPEDIITRYSGDTFVVIFPGMDNACAVHVIDRMRKNLDAWPLTIGNLLIRLTFSAGIETVDEKNRVADAAFSDFIRVAKRALKEAKNTGRDTVVSANVKNYNLDEPVRD